MAANLTFPESILEKLNKKYIEADIKIGWGEKTEESPYLSMMVLFEDIGVRKASIVFEYCFIPLMEEVTAAGIHILQTFTTIKEKVSTEYSEQLQKIISNINIQLPLGAFGLIEESGILYFKYNCIISKSVDEEVSADIIDKQGGLFLHQQILFIDMLLDVAEGKKTAGEAINSLYL